MKKLITLKKDYSIKLASSITKHPASKYLYLKAHETLNIDSKVEVKKEQTLGFSIPSPISGIVAGTKYCINENGEVIKMVSVLNDYKETLLSRRAMRKSLDNVSLKTMVEELNEFGLEKIANKFKTPIDTLVLNGVEDEPYVANEIYINKENTKEILETLDFIRERSNLSKAYIIIKNNDSENIDAYTTYLGTYSQIELLMVPDFYLLGKKEFLISFLHFNETSLVLKPSEIMKIYQTIKRRRFLSEKYITISGELVENPQVIEAKLGTPIEEIIKEHIKIKETKNPIYIINGLMSGKEANIENLVLTDSIDSILIMNHLDEVENPCWNCGKCVTICPKNCDPVNYMETKSQASIKNCIDCGLCTYICPANINLRNKIKGE